MNQYYPHLLSPIRLGNVILKNRMLCPPSDPHYIQGHQSYPTEDTIYHYAARARGGAALVTVEGCGLHGFPEKEHHWGWDASDGGTQNMMSQMADAIHFYGSKINGTIMMFSPPGYDVSANAPRITVAGDLAPQMETETQELSTNQLLELIEQYACLAKIDKDCGFDGVYIHMAYRLVLPGRMLSPLTNRRTDEFGGSFENRIRFPLMLCRRIKELCGQDFLIEASISGQDPGENGWQLADSIRFAHSAKGLIDILQIRAPEIDPNHPIGLCAERTPWLPLTEAVKKSDPPMAITAVAGFFDPEDGERVLAEGKADTISMARAFISNPNYGRLIAEGRRNELVPCIRCNKCHRSGPDDPWLSVCSVNPTWAAERRVGTLTPLSGGQKRVAVIGGGIAGLVAAKSCAERGHSVVLFEKSGYLGGLLRHADVVDFKWPIQRYIHYYIDSVMNNPAVEIKLNCTPEPEDLSRQDFDVVLAAIGAEPKAPNIPGADADGVVYSPYVYGHENELGQKVVVVGGGEVGAETGLYLARCGHEVMILGRNPTLAKEAYRVHYYSMFLEACQREPKLSWKLEAACTEIHRDGVVYRDKYGQERKLFADSIVIAAGMQARLNEVMRYSGCGRQFFSIGDCVRAGSIQSAVRSAYDITHSF